MRRYLPSRPNSIAPGIVAVALVLLVAPAPAPATVTHSIEAGTLVVRVDSDGDDLIRISCVNGLVNVSGDDPFIGCRQVRGFFVRGGPGGNTIDLSGIDVVDFPDLGDVDVRGAGGEDTITGTVLADELHGDGQGDVIAGARGADLVRGGDGFDQLVWEEGDGDDVLDGEQGSDFVSMRGTSAAADSISITPQGERFRLERSGPAPLRLDIGTTERIGAAGGPGDDSLTAAAELRTGVVLSGDEGDDVLSGTNTGDTLQGGNGDDRLAARRGEDFVFAGEGDDLIIYENGDGTDDIVGGGGIDTTRVNGAPDRGDEFVVEPTACTTPPNCDIAFRVPRFGIEDGETVIVSGRGGDDTITGSKLMPPGVAFVFRGQRGDDTIQGTDRTDVLEGGRGDDRISAVDAVFDVVECGPGSDRTELDPNDRPTRCETIDGGDERVRVASKIAKASGRVVRLKLRCVEAKRCRGTVRLRRRGKTIGRGRFRATRNTVASTVVRLNRRDARLLSARGQVRVGVRIDSNDADGNGWRSSARIRLTRRNR